MSRPHAMINQLMSVCEPPGSMAKLPRAQDHFEAILFNVMRARGFGDDYVERYKMVTKFFQQRRPLIVLICGVPCTGMQLLISQLHLDHVYLRGPKSCGVACYCSVKKLVVRVSVSFAGKSTLAQQLASRLNMPNVLQTDAIYEVCCPMATIMSVIA